MFENCGSCFATEQFVDIKLGAKYLFDPNIILMKAGIIWIVF